MAISICFLSAAGATFYIPPASADEERRTPLAGEEFRTEVGDTPVTVPARDRTKVTAASFGVQYLPNGPSGYQVLPFGAFYVWRNSDEMRQQFRGTFAGFVNDVALNIESTPRENMHATASALAIEQAFDAVGGRFDLIGFDPRGVGASQPRVQCLTDAERDAHLADVQPVGQPAPFDAMSATSIE